MMTPTFASVCGAALLLGLLGGCAADRPLRTPDVSATLQAELAASTKAPTAVPSRVSDALAEPALPVAAVPPEPRLDLLVNNANAREVFLALVADTRYSMLMHPDVAGSLSVTLRGVTVKEALESIRDVYGYDFRIEGRRITVFAPSLQTRIFTINYPQSQRTGSSDLRVTSGAMQASNGSGSSSASNSGAASAGGTGASGASGTQIENSRVSTNSRSDFWAELSDSVRSMVGNGAGRNVVSSPQAGIMAVRAMPDELRQVERFLKAAQVAVERQVMLEAKIVEVELRDGFQSGIDWSGFRNEGSATGAIGTLGGNTKNNVLVDGVKPGLPGFSTTASAAIGAVALPGAATGGLFGLALASEGFQAVLGFLETRGDIQVLSSPRIATLNNQKALLKVGSDEYFVTNVSGNSSNSSSTNSGSGSTGAPSIPTITLTPFFSGVALDVTPQIDEGNTITLHVRPSVTSVVEKSKNIDLGTIGNYKLPVASSSVNESDTMVRLQDGHIVAIGGLMQLESNRSSAGLPGTSDTPFFNNLFGNRANSGRKKEVIVLIKPSIIRSQEDWQAQTQRAREALDELNTDRARVVRLDGPSDSAK